MVEDHFLIQVPQVVETISTVTHEAPHAGQPLGERINFGMCRIDAETRAGGAVEVEAAHQRFGTVVAGADGDALAVQQGGDVMGVGLSRVKEITPPRSCARPNAQPVYGGEPGEGVFGQGGLVRLHGVVADACT